MNLPRCAFFLASQNSWNIKLKVSVMPGEKALVCLPDLCFRTFPGFQFFSKVENRGIKPPRIVQSRSDLVRIEQTFLLSVLYHIHRESSATLNNFNLSF